MEKERASKWVKRQEAKTKSSQPYGTMLHATIDELNRVRDPHTPILPASEHLIKAMETLYNFEHEELNEDYTENYTEICNAISVAILAIHTILDWHNAGLDLDGRGQE